MSTHNAARAGRSRKKLTAAAITAGAAVVFTAGSATASAPPEAGGDYCAAHLEAEAAFASGDPGLIGPAAEALNAAAPEEISEAVGMALENADAGPSSPEFTQAYNQMVEYVKENCGFNAVDVLATEYEFGGIPPEMPSGPTVFSLTNNGQEVHELVLLMRNEGVTEPVEEILALPEEEALNMVTFVNATLAFPGETGHVVADLAAGEYIAVCFLPVGATPEMVTQMMGGGGPGTSVPGTTMPMASGSSMPMASGSSVPGAGPEGSIHAMEGMIVEFTVTDGGGESAEGSATATTTG